MNTFEDDIRSLVGHIENQESQDNTRTQPADIQDIYVLIVREQKEDNTQIVVSAPLVPTQPAPATIQHDSFVSAYLFVCFSLFLVLSCIAIQLYCIMNPPIATVTIIPQSRHMTLNGIVQEGRVLAPLTIAQSQTTPATGIGHQNAKAATGYLTFYNGQFQSVTIAAGTILTGSSGVPILTDEDAVIPAGNPARGYGHTTVAAHAINVGSIGNIPTYDINVACCAISVLATNPTPFRGGQNERQFQTVTQQNIATASSSLKIIDNRSMHSALQGQLQANEDLFMLPCSFTVSADHMIGEEAAHVTVTVSETCRAVAYTDVALQAKTVAFLLHQGLQQLGTSYNLVRSLHVSITQATVTNTSTVFLSFHAQGIWIYAFSLKAQQYIRSVIAGKTKLEALHLLALLPGVEHASIRGEGFGDDTKVPKDSYDIHIQIIVQNR
jgi:hypothetical protein